MKKPSLKVLAMTAFEGELAHKLVATFIPKVRLAAPHCGFDLQSRAEDSNTLIEYAVG
jgi:hypothetical protein